MELKLVSLAPNFEDKAGWSDDFMRVKLPGGGVCVGSGARGGVVLTQSVAVKGGQVTKSFHVPAAVLVDLQMPSARSIGMEHGTNFLVLHNKLLLRPQTQKQRHTNIG